MAKTSPKRALVTGAGKRVGREMALYLGRRGFDVAVHYATSSAGADEVVKEIRSMDQTAAALQANLLDEGAVQSLVPSAVAALGGPLTLLVNNASIFEQDTYETATRHSWDMHIESNLRAPFVLTQALASQIPDPVMDDMNEPVAQGLVVNMIDQRVRKLTPDFASYTIAKMGLWAMTRTAAQALAPRVRVNGIGPGPTLQSTEQTSEQFAKQRARTVLKRGASPADITAALGYFIDAPAITGQLLCVDGGQHLAWQTPDVVGVDL
ncbi:SDR family oxidoreductase [Roseovarius rhodophyticola]|uniref:SDR family oxidoreductase n=1 Tax=Roseovarius rhodophyticola TaxID=3080827 RepID=A0ABZ2TIV6_9RHOB|nr:SDR family oxidoreductase [Roseovarius sp. W115]MDV2929891.1 SDR family oxidoreductase [Roseovarius sp. W115]